MASVVKEFKKHSAFFETVVCVTAQHREMLDQVLQIFEIVPDIDLNIMRIGQDLTDLFARILTVMRKAIKEIKPDVVLVHGDTITSTATALAAFFQQIPVGHVEAGLRTNNIYSPWPEEMNRQITGRIATYHFAPTELSRQNLLKEGVCSDNIIVTGNTVIDALHIVLKKFENNSEIIAQIENELSEYGLPIDYIKRWNGNISDRRMVLITGHRRENFGEGFIHICEAIKELAKSYHDVDFVYPMHLNPNVRKPIHYVFEESNMTTNKNIFLIEPLQYLSFIYLMKKCSLILTDSGGIQEEAPGLGKPVLVMRDTTERSEALEAGTVRLVGTQKNNIIIEVKKLLSNKKLYEKMALANNPYGDGKGAYKIINWLEKKLIIRS